MIKKVKVVPYCDQSVGCGADPALSVQPTGDIVYMNHAHTVINPEVGTPVPLTPLEVDTGPVFTFAVFYSSHLLCTSCYHLHLPTKGWRVWWARLKSEVLLSSSSTGV